MQKLLRRSPCVLASSPPLSSLPLSTTSFPPLGVFTKMTTLPSSGVNTSILTVPTFKKTSNISKPLKFSSTSSCRICTCSVEGGKVGPGRAWVVFKDCKGVGGRKAWFGSVAGGDGLDKGSFSVSVGAVEEGGEGGLGSDDGGNEGGRGKVERVQRRQRGGGGGGVLLSGNPDLLRIPGVGPRNLRKLVEKGFGGVDQLKQFYKDKVWILLLD